MFTWGYIKAACLAKLDLDSEQAISQGYVNKFYIYANEALSQICSAIKPKHTYVNFKVVDKDKLIKYLKNKYKIDDISFLDVSVFNIEDLNEAQLAFYNEYNEYTFTGENVNMPNDFLSFALNSVNYVTLYLPYMSSHGIEYYPKREFASDENFVLYGQHTVRFNTPGNYELAYNAIWYQFSSTTDDNQILDISVDIIQCLPSYIVSQCFKVDDEEKAAIYRNEYEVFLSRIDNSDDTEDFVMTIGGGW